MNSIMKNLDDDRIDLPLSSKMLEAIDRAISYELAANRQDFITIAIKEKIANLGLYDIKQMTRQSNFDIFADLAKKMIQNSREPKILEKEDNNSKKIIRFIKKHFISNNNTPVMTSTLIKKGVEHGLRKEKVEEIIQKLLTDGFLYQPKKSFVKRLL